MKRLLGLCICICLLPRMVSGADFSTEQYYREGQRFDKSRNFFQAARYYYQGIQRTSLLSEKALGYAYASNSLTALGLYQSASYFFLQAIGSADDKAIRTALYSAPVLIENLGSAIFKKYLLRYTKPEQYAPEQKDYYLYILTQDHLFGQRPQQVLTWSSQISRNFVNYPSVLFLRGTAQLIVNQVDAGVETFKECANIVESASYTRGSTRDEVQELKNRCIAGVARGYYQARNYVEADRWYDQVEVGSFVWPQVQYERAWNAIARGDYNRALGRLISYRAPSLTWFQDSEVDMLRALSYLQMCIYDEVEKETDFFTSRHTGVGDQVKTLLVKSSSGSVPALVKLFALGADAAANKVQSTKPIHQIMNRFVRSPYFIRLVQTGNRVRSELSFLDTQGQAGKQGIGAFLKEALEWRWQTAQELGGVFVRDRLSTEYKALLGNVQTMDIVKLEMLRRAKSKLEASDINASLDVWGNKKRGSLGRPRIRDDQYFWDFNGEFWADELGDYVLALKPECGT
jgi:tetratricopeptide (TPR) repeat protein